MTFEQWFQDQDFYINMRFIHGDGLFIKDGGVYRVLPVQMAFEAWQSQQAEVEEKDKQIETTLALIDTTSYSEIQRRMPDFIDQLKNALRGEHEKD